MHDGYSLQLEQGRFILKPGLVPRQDLYEYNAEVDHRREVIGALTRGFEMASNFFVGKCEPLDYLGHRVMESGPMKLKLVMLWVKGGSYRRV